MSLDPNNYREQLEQLGKLIRAFGSIEEYTKKRMGVCQNEKQLSAQPGRQIHVENNIIQRKFASVQKSLKFFALSFVLVIIILSLWPVIS